MTKDRLIKQKSVLDRLSRINPDFSDAYSNLLLTMQYSVTRDAQTIYFEHLNFAKQFAEPFASAISTHTNKRDPDRKLKIGYVSPDFRKHSVAYFIEPVITEHNREHFEIFCYSNNLIT